MKLRTATASVETSGLTDTTNFSIKVNGKAFKILLDGLYSDKVGAIVRELCTNAYDAHLAIGKGDVPFVVRLPVLFDPVFRVRDYGISMTHEQVFRLMTTVFESSKDTSNNQVGAFGLGSKSPFALVDTFSITAWKDGEKRVYSAYISADGVPALALLSREASDEAQGVQIEMTVDQRDVYTFAEKAMKILRWFPTFPKIEGNAVLLTKPSTIAQGKGWSLLGASDTYGGARARQGCVVYPLNAASIPNISEEYRALLSAPILIDFPIGSLDVAASRESLSYDETTCQNIMARLNSVADELKDHYGKAIKNAPTLWEAGKKLRELGGSSLPHALVSLISLTKWKGTKSCSIFQMRDLSADLDAKGVRFSPYFWPQYRMGRLSASVNIDAHSLTEGKRLQWTYGDDSLSIYFTVEGARPTYEGRRIIEDYKRAARRGSVLLFVLAKEDDHKSVLDALGNPPATLVKWTRELPEPVLPNRPSTAKRGTTKKVEVKVREVARGADGFGLSAEKIVQLSGSAQYVILRSGYVDETRGYGQESEPISTFIRKLSTLDSVGYVTDTVPIYVVSVVYEKRVKDFKGWVPLIPEVRKAVSRDFEDRLFVETEKSHLHRVLANCNWCTLLRQDARFGRALEQLQSGPLYGLYRTIQAHGLDNTPACVTGVYKDMSNAAWSLGIVGLSVHDLQQRVQKRLHASPKLADLSRAISACSNAYPLLRGYDHYKLSRGTSADLTAILEYIEALDTVRAQRAAAETAAQNVARAA